MEVICHFSLEQDITKLKESINLFIDINNADTMLHRKNRNFQFAASRVWLAPVPRVPWKISAINLYCRVVWRALFVLLHNFPLTTSFFLSYGAVSPIFLATCCSWLYPRVSTKFLKWKTFLGALASLAVGHFWDAKNHELANNNIMGIILKMNYFS